MSQPHPHSQPILTSVAAHLYVRDLKVSAEFFTQKLGFILDFVYGDPPFYGQVSRDNARLALRHMDEPVFAGDIRRTGGPAVRVNHAGQCGGDQAALPCISGAPTVPFHQVLRKEPWGASTFIVQDPDGNLILFAGPAD